MIKADAFRKKALAMGAAGAKIIDPSTIATAAWVRLKCQYGCGGYGGCLCCPPHSPPPEQTRAVLDCYSKALLVHCKPKTGVNKIVVTLEREIFLAGFHKALAFGAGPCRLCKECDMDACRHPEKARPSMEACGIDVYQTARANGFPIQVVKDESSDQNYFGVVLIE